MDDLNAIANAIVAQGRVPRGQGRLTVRCPICLEVRQIGACDWRKRKSDNCESCNKRVRFGLAPTKATNDAIRSERKRRARERIKADPDRLAKQRAYHAAYRQAHADALRERGKEWRTKNAVELKRKRAEWRAKKLAENEEEFRANRRRVNQESAARVRARDPDLYKKRAAENSMRARATEKGKIHSRMNARMNAALKAKRAGSKSRMSWVQLVGYTVDDLVMRLKRTLPSGYTWADFLAGKLHIDHIVPVSAFNFATLNCVDFKRCWSLKNLQLLPVRENLQKNARLIAPFQPSLL